MATPAPTAPRIRRLSAVEIDSYDVLPPELARRVRLIRVRLLFLVGPYQGMTLGRIILLRDSLPPDGWSGLLAHELVHVRQWTELGVIGFSYRYLRDFVAGLVRTRSWNQAYLDIEAEREARELTKSWFRRRNPTE
ncbi:MAG: hypothetical protein AAF962_00330 [Actinomycetota bacterium]